MLTTRSTILAAAGLTFAAQLASADVIDLVSSRDGTLYQSSDGLSANGAGSGFFAGRNSQSTNNLRRGLLFFDLSAIPAGSTITAATLRLNNSAANIAPANVNLHRALESWGEGTSVSGGGGGNGVAPSAGDATWLHRSFSGSLWSTPGGVFSPVPSATTSVAGPGFYQWTSPSLIADLQMFLDTPATNLGWVLLGDENVVQSAKRFSTREEPSANLRPTLTVEYIPSPAAFALFTLALLPRTRRR